MNPQEKSSPDIFLGFLGGLYMGVRGGSLFRDIFPGGLFPISYNM